MELADCFARLHLSVSLLSLSLFLSLLAALGCLPTAMTCMRSAPGTRVVTPEPTHSLWLLWLLWRVLLLLLLRWGTTIAALLLLRWSAAIAALLLLLRWGATVAALLLLWWSAAVAALLLLHRSARTTGSAHATADAG